MEQPLQVEVRRNHTNVTVPGQDAERRARQFVVVSVVFGLPVLPAALFWEWHLRWSVSPNWIRMRPSCTTSHGNLTTSS
jgi:hypothetical protein